MRFATFLFALSLVLAGCREYIVNEPPPSSNPQPGQPGSDDLPPIGELPSLTLKGPSKVSPGQRVLYRAQAGVPGADRWVFLYGGEIPILEQADAEPEDPNFYAQVVGEGPVALTVRVYDAQGIPIAETTRVIVSESEE